MIIKRVVNLYSNETENLVKEVIIPELSLPLLKGIVPAKYDDPLMYDSYPLNEQQIKQLNEYLDNGIECSFSDYAYYLECYQIT